MKKKVLFMTNYPAPYRVDFFNQLGKYVDLTVTFEEDAQRQGERDQKWFSSTAQTFTSVVMHPSVEIGSHQIVSLQLHRLLSKKFDFVIVGVYSTINSILAMGYMRLAHIPYLIEIDGGIIKDSRRPTELLKRILLSSASGYFSPSEAADEYLKHYGASGNIYRYHFSSIREKDVLPLERAHSVSQLRRKIGITEELVVLGVGQTIHRKGWDLLLNAAAKIQSTRRVGIYIIGGETTKEYREIIQHQGLSNIHFISFLEKSKLSAYYECSDCFVLPTREDIWGLVVNEAMAFNLPVVTTDKCLAGIAMVNEGENGFVVPTEDSDMLAHAIRRILDQSHEQRTRFRSNAHNVAKKYTIEQMVKAHLDVFLENNTESW